MEMVGAASLRASVSMETTCGALLRELEHIWTEIGETDAEKDQMLLDLEMECLGVYRRKVEEANKARARLHQSLAAKEAELAALVASLGEHGLHLQAEKKQTSLKEQLTFVTPLLEDLRVKKEERIRQFADVRSQIQKINAEISGYNQHNDAPTGPVTIEEHDLSIRKFNEYQTQLRNLQKEKSERLHKVLEFVNEVHSLCGVLGEDFGKTVSEVHPSLHEPGLGKSTNISDNTLKGLAQVILKLKEEKKIRMQKLRRTVESLFKLWDLMDSSEEERGQFGKITSILGSPVRDITHTDVLSLETIKQTEAEVERLTKLKASRMKEIVLKKRLELEDICRGAHIEPDMSTAPEKSIALIESGLVDPSELLNNIEAQIGKAKEESIIRKEIMDRVSKWLAACEEEKWLEEYNQDENRYSAGRGAHLNLKRAEKARLTVNKIPAIVDNLMSKTFAWEDERNTPFLFDGVRLVKILEEYKLMRQQKEEEKRRYRVCYCFRAYLSIISFIFNQGVVTIICLVLLKDQKKLQNLLQTEKEAVFGSKPSPKRNSFNKKASGYQDGNGFMTPTPRRVSVGSATPELLTPRSYSGRQNGYFKEMRRLSTTPLNFVALPKEDNLSSYASVSGSEPGSPPHT